MVLRRGNEKEKRGGGIKEVCNREGRVRICVCRRRLLLLLLLELLRCLSFAHSPAMYTARRHDSEVPVPVPAVSPQSDRRPQPVVLTTMRPCVVMRERAQRDQQKKEVQGARCGRDGGGAARLSPLSASRACETTPRRHVWRRLHTRARQREPGRILRRVHRRA